MGFLKSRMKNRIRNETSFSLNDPEADLFFNTLGINPDGLSKSELNEITYFTCLKHLTETMSKMPWEKYVYNSKKGKEKVFDNDLDILLNLRPNPLYSAAVFWGSIELNKNHYGNAYAYIQPGIKGKPSGLWLLPTNEVQIWRDDKTLWGSSNAIWYVWTDSRTGKRYRFSQNEILHFKTAVTFDGIVGLSVKNILLTQIQSKISADGFLKKLYDHNMFGSKILLYYTGDLNTGAATKMAATIEEYSKNKGSGKFIPLPTGIEAKLMDMKLSDAQFFENQKLNALQIAAAFGIKPNVINNYEKSSYSNSETQQLDFYVNTLQPSFTSYSQESTWKLLPNFEIKSGKRLKINEKILFKMDNKTQAEVLKTYMNNFMITPNQALEELGLPYSNNPIANDLIGNGNYIKLSQVGDQWNKNRGGE